MDRILITTCIALAFALALTIAVIIVYIKDDHRVGTLNLAVRQFLANRIAIATGRTECADITRAYCQLVLMRLGQDRIQAAADLIKAVLYAPLECLQVVGETIDEPTLRAVVINMNAELTELHKNGVPAATRLLKFSQGRLQIKRLGLNLPSEDRRRRMG